MPATGHPAVGQRIPRTEAQRLDNMSLGFFGTTDKSLSKSDNGMGDGEISIQRQGVFTFGDAPCGAFGEDVDIPKCHMAPRMVRDRGQRFGQLRLGRSEGRHGSRHK